MERQIESFKIAKKILKYKIILNFKLLISLKYFFAAIEDLYFLFINIWRIVGKYKV